MVTEGGSGVCVGGTDVGVSGTSVAVGGIGIGVNVLGVVAGELHPTKETINVTPNTCCNNFRWFIFRSFLGSQPPNGER